LAKEFDCSTDQSQIGSGLPSLVEGSEMEADGSPSTKRAREERIEDLGNGQHLPKGSPDGKRAAELDKFDKPENLKPPEDLSQGHFLLNEEHAEGLRLRQTGSGSTMKASAATSDAARAIREQKAVKSDNAEVPKHLWEEHLFDGSGWAEVWTNDQERFTKACKLLKSRMLRCWKRTVTQSLNVWINGQCPPIQEDFFESSPVVIRQGESCAWSAGGRAACSKWWHVRMSESCIDLMPGSDAVARAANSNWFKWDDGSRHFQA
jgi:hypothetical protein